MKKSEALKMAMIAVHRRLKEAGLDASLVLQVHDELLIETSKDCKEQALKLLKEDDGAYMYCRDV